MSSRQLPPLAAPIFFCLHSSTSAVKPANCQCPDPNFPAQREDLLCLKLKDVKNTSNTHFEKYSSVTAAKLHNIT
jgi:hypothetical protein